MARLRQPLVRQPQAECTMFHLISIWLTRIVVLGVAIALAVMYVIPAYFGEQPAVSPEPRFTERPMARVAPTAPAEPTSSGEQTTPVAAHDGSGAEANSSTRRCRPIARTASGDLVYSMDCRQLPAE